METRAPQSRAEHHQGHEQRRGTASTCRGRRRLQPHSPARRSPCGKKHGRPGASSPAGHSLCRRRSSRTREWRVVQRWARWPPDLSPGRCTWGALGAPEGNSVFTFLTGTQQRLPGTASRQPRPAAPGPWPAAPPPAAAGFPAATLRPLAIWPPPSCWRREEYSAHACPGIAGVPLPCEEGTNAQPRWPLRFGRGVLPHACAACAIAAWDAKPPSTRNSSSSFSATHRHSANT